MRKLMLITMTLFLLLTGAVSVALAQGPADHYSTVVLDTTDPDNVFPIPGTSASLVTTDQGATLQVNTSGLIPGHAYTVWWAIFNHPENCSDGVCGPDDAFPPPGNVAAGAYVSFATGHVIGGSGQGNFGAYIAAGGIGDPWAVGLIDARTAEYHFILRDHGPTIPGLVNGQISTPGVGCNNLGPPPQDGPYTCADVQAGVFGP